MLGNIDSLIFKMCLTAVHDVQGKKKDLMKYDDIHSKTEPNFQ